MGPNKVARLVDLSTVSCERGYPIQIQHVNFSCTVSCTVKKKKQLCTFPGLTQRDGDCVLEMIINTQEGKEIDFHGKHLMSKEEIHKAQEKIGN